jgi:hypothetical protein
MAEQRSRGIITDITGLTDEEILESVHQNAFESDYYKHCMNVLQLWNRAEQKKRRSTEKTPSRPYQPLTCLR